MALSMGIYSAENVIQVIVKDVNDNSPQFENQPYNADVNEDESTGSQVYTNIHATDINNGPGGNVRYKLEPVTQGGGGTEHDTKFMINATTGDLTLNGSLDYERKTFYHFIVIASDQGTPSLNSTTDLFVTVKDVQDSPPVFTNLPYVKSVDENTAQGHSVLTVKAVDQDQAIPNQVGYNITHS
ncbi:cadherin-related family member 1-like [Littorina saxatilis]|uniref:cadherin-related family member 1-like n=1 Tax=Littorina saxatilis TaxID=31220 RepID=UPI0038B61969